MKIAILIDSDILNVMIQLMPENKKKLYNTPFN